jgi:hypothetical protein
MLRDRLYAVAVGCAAAAGFSWHLSRLVGEQPAQAVACRREQLGTSGVRPQLHYDWQSAGRRVIPDLVPFAAAGTVQQKQSQQQQLENLEQFLRRRWAFTWNESINALLDALQQLDAERLQRYPRELWQRWRRQQSV